MMMVIFIWEVEKKNPQDQTFTLSQSRYGGYSGNTNLKWHNPFWASAGCIDAVTGNPHQPDSESGWTKAVGIFELPKIFSCCSLILISMASPVTTPCLDCCVQDVCGVCLYVIGKALQRQDNISSRYVGQSPRARLNSCIISLFQCPASRSLCLSKLALQFRNR